MKNSIIGMFREGAQEMSRDMNKIVGMGEAEIDIPPGRPGASSYHPTTPEEAAQAEANRQKQRLVCRELLKREGDETNPADPEAVEGCMLFLKQYFPEDLAGGGDAGGDPIIDDPYPQPSAGSMMDLSSPVNTMVKAVFIGSLSSMFSGPHYYIITAGCAAAILFSITKFFKQ